MAGTGYVAISEDPTDKVIRFGPIKWDPKDAYDPGPGLDLMLESEALLAGYTYPVDI